MFRRFLILWGVFCLSATGQTTCPAVNFLSARTVNLKPSSNSHITLVRQNDGSYTGYELADAAPYRLIRTTPHFERQFAACLPHNLPAALAGARPVENPPGAESQSQVSMTLANGNYFVASTSAGNSPILFDVLDPRLNLIQETKFAVPNAAAPLALKLADVNGDGKLDLIAFSATPLFHGFVSISTWTFLGNGDGSFQSGFSQDLPVSQDSPGFFDVVGVSFAVADVDGDGKPDLLAIVSALGFKSFLLLGNGDGTFRERNLVLSVPDIGPFALADLNSDGKPDLVFIAAGSVAVELGNGDGTFQTPVSFPILEDGNTAVAVGDVNGDGIPDIVTSTGSILFGDGKGGFPTRRDYVVSREFVLNGTESVMLADFDGDGKTDILIGTGNPILLSGGLSDPSLTVLFGQGGGAFVAAPVSFAGVGGIPQTLSSADFEGDGIPDLAVVSSSPSFVAVLKGKGNGEFLPGFRYDSSNDGYPVSAAVADFNRDGKPDLAVLFSGASTTEVQIFLGQGDGTLAPPATIPIPGVVAGIFPSFIGAPDLNGDGIPDLVVSTNNMVLVWLGKAGGVFSGPVSYAVEGGYLSSGNPVSLAFGDFNGDGKLDIAVPSQATG